MEKTTLYLPTELLAIYTAMSRSQNRSRADLMREALREHAQRDKRKLPEWV